MQIPDINSLKTYAIILRRSRGEK